MNHFFSRAFVFLLALAGVTLSCSPPKPGSEIKSPNLIEFTVQRSMPHDTKAFTQGLVIHRGQLYESTGQENSWIGTVDIQTGVAAKRVTLDKKYFGEGITILNSKIYQLTWQTKTGFVYALRTFEKVSEFTYDTEGWGLTHDGTSLIMSDGTESLYFMDTVAFKVSRKLTVTYQEQPVRGLNELEYIEGFVYANIWQTDLIAKIDPSTGKVSGFLNLAELSARAKALYGNADVLNGIAWHESTKMLLVTGKNWPLIYVLRLK
ncbi:MAG: glutaminyl-peptide cyclotransferase [Cytophagales bacterium]|nr:glutaminyl-peptide cyclotransferase [Cytophagales bacterium]